MRLSIKTKLILAFLGTTVLSILIGVVTIAGLYFVRPADEDPLAINPLVGLGTAFFRTNALQKAVQGGGDLAAIRAAAIPKDLSPGLRVQVVSPGGEVLIDSAGQEGRILTTDEVMRMLESVSNQGQRSITVLRAIMKDNKLWGYYTLSFQASFSPSIQLGDATPESRLATWVILGGQGIGLLSCLLLFWFFGRHLVRPIRHLSNVMGQIAAGDLTVRTKLHNRRDEIGQLAQDLDIMALRLHEAQARATAAVQSRQFMVAAASHDLRTPLTAILAHVEAIRTGISEDPERSLSIVEEKGLLMKRLINDLFELAALDANQEQWQTFRVDLAELVRRQVVGILPDLEATSIQVDADIPETPLWANVAKGKLERVMDNLLTNAAKYGREGQWIGVRVARVGSHLRVEVTDRGQGIPADQQAHVFERFYRSDLARTGTVEGSGMGLAIAKEIIMRHRGTIGVETPPEGGTRFWFELTAAPQ